MEGYESFLLKGEMKKIIIEVKSRENLKFHSINMFKKLFIQIFGILPHVCCSIILMDETINATQMSDVQIPQPDNSLVHFNKYFTVK